MDETGGKRAVIDLSSSSSEEDDFDEEMEDWNSEAQVCDGDEYEDEDEDEDGDQDETSESDDGDDDDEYLSNKVIDLLEEGNNIESLKLKECKAYLRKHSLRLAGNRADCVARIREHWRLKDGKGYMLYPRSSFIIDCTGDVCKGDVVLFRQKVYEKFDKVIRHGRLLGNRTVAGRVVKESYGAAKQQHTFTVEVIWSSGVRKLPPLFPLLVKGRNLYKQKTYRQRWKIEADRAKVLSEKHRRGAAARFLRALKQKKKNSFANELKGSNQQHEIHKSKRSKIRRSHELEKVRHRDGCRRAINFRHQEASSAQSTWKENASSRAFRSSRGWHKSDEIDHYQVPIDPLYANYHQSSYQSRVNSHISYEPCEYSNYKRGSIQNKIEFPSLRHHINQLTNRSPHLVSNDSSCCHASHRYSFEMKNLNAENVGRPLHPLSSTTKHGWRKYGV